MMPTIIVRDVDDCAYSNPTTVLCLVHGYRKPENIPEGQPVPAQLAKKMPKTSALLSFMIPPDMSPMLTPDELKKRLASYVLDLHSSRKQVEIANCDPNNRQSPLCRIPDAEAQQLYHYQVNPKAKVVSNIFRI
jgi:hypothetical protein